jgi:chromosome segregation protein
VIAELDEVMRREFHATFKEVSARFKENFSRLFGGGSARLTLTDPDDIGSTGIEISAQPPGKRPQTLALLSGGERALTAVSLIFSILEVNPPPFCILDEVDAMLDEANVGRFRQALEALNRHTQFIVITHNRGTIQAANTIYGVSMGDDSVSQVVSLRLEGERIAAPDGSPVEVGDR